MENLKIKDYCGSVLEVSYHGDGSVFIKISDKHGKQMFAVEKDDIQKLVTAIQQKEPTVMLEEFRDDILKNLPIVSSNDADKYKYKVGQHILNINLNAFIK